ncbi:MAG: FeoB-associated Cys-rich membrane protein [Clostridia bacterium]|nr:FeoB-associated Cys-rich membrane protein [Clostridia bacterium]
MANIISVIVIVLILGGAMSYIIRSRKKGRKCIGCPYCDSCPSGKSSSCKSNDN